MAMGVAACAPHAGSAGPPEPLTASGDEVFPHWAFHREGCRAYRDLHVEGFLPATLYVPGGPGPHPLVVTAHGAHGDPEGSCRYWCHLTEGGALVLSLRGRRTDNTRPSGYYYPDHHALDAELRAAMSALRARVEFSIDASRSLYSGFSQGAIMAALVLPDHAGDFPRVAFIEGGFQYWSRASVTRFAKNGGQRVLFACGTEWCRRGSDEIARWLRSAGVDARLEHAPGAGHTPEGGVRERVKAALPWLLGPG
jgi:poly(3-hydroxybutyrate) depolymerase